jgi:hypothetical protein
MKIMPSTSAQQTDSRPSGGGEPPAQRRRWLGGESSLLQARGGRPNAGSSSRPRLTLTELHTRIFDDQSIRAELRQIGKLPQIGKLSQIGKLPQIDEVPQIDTKPQIYEVPQIDTKPQLRTTCIEKYADLNGRELASDGHMHPTNYAQRGLVPRELLKRMDEIGIRNTTLMPIPTSIASPTEDAARRNLDGHHCGELYYIPSQHANIKPHELTPQIRQEIVAHSELYMDTGVDASTVFRLKDAQLSQAQMDRFDPMITGLHLGSPLSGEVLLRKLYEMKGTFTGVGEITLHKEFVENMFAGRAQANLTHNIESFKDLMGVAGMVGMPVVLHCDVDSLDNQARRHEPGNQPAHLEGLRRLFSDPKLANTNIVWAHAGGLGRFVMEPQGHDNQLQEMLDLHPKLNIDISWSKVAEQLTATPQAMDRWAAFLEKNNSRVLFGSDTLSPANNEKWNETRQIYSGLLDRLSGGARANILNGNYDRVFVAARPKVREFEEKVLTRDFYSNKLMASNGPRATADWLRPLAEAALAKDITAAFS